VHTGLRPYCESARLTADDVEEVRRGMMWRVYATKTKKARKIPVRPEVAELTRRLMTAAPPGSGRPLSPTPTGKPWRKVNGVARFIGLRRVPEEVVMTIPKRGRKKVPRAETAEPGFVRHRPRNQNPRHERR
jgi:integrase